MIRSARFPILLQIPSSRSSSCRRVFHAPTPSINYQSSSPWISSPLSALILPIRSSQSRSNHTSAAMSNVLVIGSTRGLGASFVKQYSTRGDYVFGTARGDKAPDSEKNLEYIKGIDVSQEISGDKLAKAIETSGKQLDLVIFNAGYLAVESFDEPNFENELMMYKICAIGPVFMVRALVKAGLMKKGSKLIFLSSESGSITLRHDQEGGGMYGHHASKTALNMVGHLLSYDLKDKEIAVGMLHPGFMRTEMTKSAGFDKFWDQADAVTPDQAADYISKFIDTFDMSKTGTYWAPRGGKDISNAEVVLGKEAAAQAPLQLPW